MIPKKLLRSTEERTRHRIRRDAPGDTGIDGGHFVIFPIRDMLELIVTEALTHDCRYITISPVQANIYLLLRL
jgi:hypothetical protein